jgi:hypothetical protein
MCSIHEGDAHKILVTMPEGKKSLGKRRHIWKHDIKMNLKNVGCGMRVLTGFRWFRIGSSDGLF